MERGKGGKDQERNSPIALFLEYKGGGKRREKKCPASRNDEKRRENTTGGKKERFSLCVPFCDGKRGGGKKCRKLNCFCSARVADGGGGGEVPQERGGVEEPDSTFGGRKGGSRFPTCANRGGGTDTFLPRLPYLQYSQQQAVIVIEKGKKTLIRNGGGNGGGREKCKCDFRIPLYYTSPPAFVRKAMLRDETKRASGKKEELSEYLTNSDGFPPPYHHFPLSLHPLRHVKKPFF